MDYSGRCQRTCDGCYRQCRKTTGHMCAHHCKKCRLLEATWPLCRQCGRPMTACPRCNTIDECSCGQHLHICVLRPATGSGRIPPREGQDSEDERRRGGPSAGAAGATGSRPAGGGVNLTPSERSGAGGPAQGSQGSPPKKPKTTEAAKAKDSLTQKKVEAFKLPVLPKAGGIRNYKSQVRAIVCSASPDPDDTFSYLDAAHKADATFASVAATVDKKRRPLDSKFSAAIMLTASSDTELGAELSLLNETAALEGRLITGIELYLCVIQWHQLDRAKGQVCSYRHLLKVKRDGQGWIALQKFVTKFKDVLLSIPDRPADAAILTLFEDQVEDSDVIKVQMDRYKDLDEDDNLRSYKNLLNIVETQLNKRRVRINGEAVISDSKLHGMVATEDSKKTKAQKKQAAKEKRIIFEWNKHLEEEKKKNGTGQKPEELLLAALQKVSGSAAKGGGSPKAKAKAKAGAKDTNEPKLTDESFKKCLEAGCCAKFQLGLCKKTDCKHKHELISGLKKTSPATSQSPRQSKPKSEILCKFFKKGTCDRGDDCEWSHSKALLGTVALAAMGAEGASVPAENDTIYGVMAMAAKSCLKTPGQEKALKQVAIGGAQYKALKVATMIVGLCKNLAENTSLTHSTMQKVQVENICQYTIEDKERLARGPPDD